MLGNAPSGPDDSEPLSLRLSVWLEDADDLVRDLAQALKTTPRSTTSLVVHQVVNSRGGQTLTGIPSGLKSQRCDGMVRVPLGIVPA
jgi:hypothetical protein